VADVEIDVSLVRALLEDQHPDLAHLTLTEVGGGWDNRLFRLGDRWLVRLPRRALSAPLVEHERRWLPELAVRLPLPVPMPVRIGRPGRGFPWSWSIVPWLAGEPLIHGRLDRPVRTAIDLEAFLRALHQPAPAGAPLNPWRGVPLSAREPILQAHLDQLGAAVDRAAVLALWRRVVATPVWSSPPVWIHGDLHPGNLLVDGGRLSGVIDFGDVTSGDPATDFAIAWMLTPAFRQALREAGRNRPTPLDGDTWARARGWALALGVAYVAASPRGDPMIALGRATIDAALGDKD
jgi:aminoglycoside phosphotransferase (APT) family kinase protein